MQPEPVSPRISEADAIRFARNHAVAKCWPWHEDSVHAWFDADIWYITTHPDTEWIANVHVELCAKSGEIIGGNHRPDIVDPITRRRALELARAIIQENGWEWRDVFVCKDEFDSDDGRRINCWTVGTNRGRMGGNATIILDAETGAVLETSFVSR